MEEFMDNFTVEEIKMLVDSVEFTVNNLKQLNFSSLKVQNQKNAEIEKLKKIESKLEAIIMDQ